MPFLWNSTRVVFEYPVTWLYLKLHQALDRSSSFEMPPAWAGRAMEIHAAMTIAAIDIFM
jgi:hypothetical protein